MLLQQTPDTLCDGQPPSGDPFDKRARSDRARSGALMLLAELLELRSPAAAAVTSDGGATVTSTTAAEPAAATIEPYDELLYEVVSASKVWKLAAKSEPSAKVRGAVYSLIAALAQHAPQQIPESSMKRMLGAAYAGLAESDLGALRSSWNAVFQLARYVATIPLLSTSFVFNSRTLMGFGAPHISTRSSR